MMAGQYTMIHSFNVQVKYFICKIQDTGDTGELSDKTKVFNKVVMKGIRFKNIHFTPVMFICIIDLWLYFLKREIIISIIDV